MLETPIEDTLIVAAHARLYEEFAAQSVVTSEHEGYFAVPRGVSLKQLSDEHGISDREGFELLREGLDTVVREQLKSM
jgi:hypothetical protein